MLLKVYANEKMSPTTPVRRRCDGEIRVGKGAGYAPASERPVLAGRWQFRKLRGMPPTVGIEPTDAVVPIQCFVQSKYPDLSPVEDNVRGWVRTYWEPVISGRRGPWSSYVVNEVTVYLARRTLH